MQRANDFGYMLATHDKAPVGVYNLLALANGVPDGFRTHILSHSQAQCCPYKYKCVFSGSLILIRTARPAKHQHTVASERREYNDNERLSYLSRSGVSKFRKYAEELYVIRRLLFFAGFEMWAGDRLRLRRSPLTQHN